MEREMKDPGALYKWMSGDIVDEWGTLKKTIMGGVGTPVFGAMVGASAHMITTLNGAPDIAVDPIMAAIGTGAAIAIGTSGFFGAAVGLKCIAKFAEKPLAPLRSWIINTLDDRQMRREEKAFAKATAKAAKNADGNVYFVGEVGKPLNQVSREEMLAFKKEHAGNVVELQDANDGRARLNMGSKVEYVTFDQITANVPSIETNLDRFKADIDENYVVMTAETGIEVAPDDDPNGMENDVRYLGL